MNIEKEYEEKVKQFVRIVKQQNKKNDLTYREDEEKKILKEMKALQKKLPKDYFEKGAALI